MGIFDFEELFNNKASKEHTLYGLINPNRFDSFEDAIFNAVNEQLKSIKIAEKKIIKLTPKLKEVKSEEEFNLLSQKQMDMYSEIGDCEMDIFFIKEQLLSIGEMDIVYLFKNVEIILKKIIQESYKNTNTRDFYKWDNMSDFFKSKNITLSSIDGNEEVTQLKNVNNAIKHNGEIGKTVESISEFVGVSEFTFDNLNSFRSRVKPKVQIFLKTLVDEIIKDLFDFSDTRIETIANEYKERMDKKSIEKLVTKLKDK